MMGRKGGIWGNCGFLFEEWNGGVRLVLLPDLGKAREEGLGRTNPSSILAHVAFGAPVVHLGGTAQVVGGGSELKSCGWEMNM